jgi:predicted alpha/beta-hydrolase family hydrolase
MRQDATGPIRIRTLLASALFACALIVGVGLLLLGCGGASKTPDSAGPGTVGAKVTFSAADGVSLGGHVFGSGHSGIVLAHMYPADQTSWFATATELAAKGYLVLTFDFRGYGESPGTKQIDRIDKDVDAAVKEIQSLGATSLALVGASMGGTASLVVAAHHPVAAVATLSAPVEFQGLSARQAVTTVTAPKLFLAAEKDAGEAGARDLYTLAPDPKEIRIFPGSDHGTALLSGSSAADVRAILFAFLEKNLPPG